MAKFNSIYQECTICEKEYLIRPSHAHLRKTCSRECAAIARKGISPANKNQIQKYCLGCNAPFFSTLSRLKKGRRYCSRICFNKTLIGKPSKNKGKSSIFLGKHRPEVMEEKQSKWKGENAGYRALHQWVYRWRGKPSICEGCNKSGLTGRQINWANRSHQYKRDLDDWIALCKKCHRAYDREHTGAIQKRYGTL